MATNRNKKNPAVDLKLRRKMLERWENEGGKIGEIDPNPPSTGIDLRVSKHKTGSQIRPTTGK